MKEPDVLTVTRISLVELSKKIRESVCVSPDVTFQNLRTTELTELGSKLATNAEISSLGEIPTVLRA